MTSETRSTTQLSHDDYNKIKMTVKHLKFWITVKHPIKFL